MPGLLNEIPAAAYAELREKRRDVEFHGAHGDAEGVSDFLVDAMIEQLLEHIVFARAEFNVGGKAASEMKKLLGVASDLIDQAVFRGNPDDVVRGRFAARHASQCEQAGGATQCGVAIAVHLDLKFWCSGMFLAEHEPFRILGRLLVCGILRCAKKLLELLGFSKNDSPP